MTVTHTTIAHSGGRYGIFVTWNVLRLKSSILSIDQGVNCEPGISLTGLGINILFNSDDSGDINCCGGITFINPKLGSFANNGEPTWTIMLNPGSPGIDAISAGEGCGVEVLTDQRGKTRPMGSGCDIGAVENEIKSYLPLVMKED